MKVTDPKNGALPVGDASVEEIKKLIAAYVTLHPTSHVGNVWSFHIDAGASIVDASGRVVSTTDAVDTKGVLSGE